MKMVTKTFLKHRHAMMLQIESPVQAALIPGLSFYFDGSVCRVDGRNIAFACKTPDALLNAWILDIEITFSVTLPAEYWRKP